MSYATGVTGAMAGEIIAYSDSRVCLTTDVEIEVVVAVFYTAFGFGSYHW
jgi:hypothetical protein